MLGEGVLTELLRIVYEIFFSNASKTLYFARDFLIAGITATGVNHDTYQFSRYAAQENLVVIVNELTHNSCR